MVTEFGETFFIPVSNGLDNNYATLKQEEADINRSNSICPVMKYMKKKKYDSEKKQRKNDGLSGLMIIKTYKN